MNCPTCYGTGSIEKPNTKKDRSDFLPVAIPSLIQAGFSYRETAKRLGCSPTTVLTILQEKSDEI